LVGDFAPEEVVRAVAPVERRDVRALESVRVRHAPGIPRSQLRGLREEPESHQQVGLAATHSLLEMKDGLGRRSRESGDALADEVLHALGDVGLLKEGVTIAFSGDQLVELLNLVAELYGQRIRLKDTRIANGLHLSISLVRAQSHVPDR